MNENAVIKNVLWGVPVVVQQVKNPTGSHEDKGQSHGLGQWVKDPALPGLWCRPTTAPIQPLTWELPYAEGNGRKKKQKKKKVNIILKIL